MRATIFLQNITLHALIGVRARERRRRQRLAIDVSLEADLPGLGRADTLDTTVDYSDLHDRIVSLVEASTCGLIETLAHRVGETCLADPRVLCVEVTVRKPHALGFADAAGVSVRMARDA